MYNIKGMFCKYLIHPSLYFRGLIDTYGQSIKFSKKPQTIILRKFATVEKLSFSVQFLNAM
jgi:hypothetical protein